MAFNYASFKNSRVEPTPATTASVQSEVTAPADTSGDPVPVLFPANLQRTYLTLENLHATDTFRFLNYSGSGPIPTKAQILARGFVVPAGTAYEVDSPEAVYALSTTANPIPISADEGQD